MRNNDSITLTEKLRNKINIYRENKPSAFIFILVIVSNLAAVMLSSLLLVIHCTALMKGRSEIRNK